MDRSDHSMNTLFQQLGLPATDHDIDQFLATHTLASGTRLENAAFWTTAQADFITEALSEDADWVEIIDQLDARLRR